MIINKDLDFCVVPTPVINRNNFVIFIIKKNEKDENLNEDEYNDLVYFLNSVGYREIDYMTFEQIEDPEVPLHEKDIIIKTLEKEGMTYNKNLENIMNAEMKKAKSNYYGIPDIELFVHPQKNNALIRNSVKNKVPDLKEKVNLSFYLFLECKIINEEEVLFTLNGDFFSSKNEPTRNFIKIANSDFSRIGDDDENKIVLMSDKSYHDFVREVDILHQGTFNLMEKNNGKESPIFYEYSIIEIINDLPKNNIVVEVAKKDYYKLLELSKLIKDKNRVELSQIIPKNFIYEKMDYLRNIFSSYMNMYSESEEYEKAAEFKSYLSKLKDKESKLLDLEEDYVIGRDYYKIFSIN